MDSNAISWDIPAQRTKKTEKYDFPVLTMSAIELKGSNRKFSLNKSAIEILGLVGGESKVNIGFKGNQVFITKGSKFNVGKNCSFSDKRVFEYLVKLWNLNTRVENEFAIITVEGQSYMELSPIAEEIEVMQSGDRTIEQREYNGNYGEEVPSILRESAKVLQESDNSTSIEDIITNEVEDIDESIDFSNVADMGVTNSSDSDWE